MVQNKSKKGKDAFSHPLSLTLFNIFLKQIMTDALEKNDRKIKIGSKFSQELPKPLQLWQSWNQFGQIATFLLDQRWNCCPSLSFPHFCMPVNHGPWQQSYRRERRLLRWDATEGYWIFPTRTMLPIWRFTERSKQPLENMTNSWPWSRNEN